MASFFKVKDLESIDYVPQSKHTDLAEDLDRILRAKVGNNLTWASFMEKWGHKPVPKTPAKEITKMTAHRGRKTQGKSSTLNG